MAIVETPRSRKHWQFAISSLKREFPAKVLNT